MHDVPAIKAAALLQQPSAHSTPNQPQFRRHRTVRPVMDRKEPKFVDIRSIIERLDALESQGAPASSQKLVDLQDLDERMTDLERRIDELTDLVDKLKAVLTI